MSTYNQGNPSVSQVISASNVFVYGNTSSGNALSVQQLGAGNVASFRTQTGASALFVSSAGNVGVGITNPIAQLHAYQSNGTGYQLSINNIYNTGGSNYSAFIHSDQAFCGGTGGVGQYTYSGAGLLVTSYPNNTSNNSGYTAYFGTSDNSAGSLAPQMVIKAATGNVGIGTTNPTEVGQVGSLLHIYDASVNNPTMTVDATGGTGQARIRLKAGLAPSTFRANRIDFYSNTNLIWTQITDYNQNGTNEMSFVSLGKGYASGSVLTLTQAGNVGIGITNPGYPLTVNGEARASQFTTTTGSFYSALSSSGTTFVGSAPGTNIQIWSGSADTRIFSSSGTPINFGVNSSGSSAGNNVGIGITNPGYTFQVGNFNGNSNLNGCLWVNPQSDADARHYFTITASSTSIATNADGRLNIQDRSSIFIRFFAGTATSATLYGTISQSGGSTLYNASSDYRLKSNVEPLSNALDIINSLRPVSFTFNSHPDKIQVGFIAHEVQEIVPECITGVKDAVADDGSILPQGIDKSYLVSYLTKAIQELSAENTALKQSLATATARLDSLEARLAAAGL